MQPLNDVLVNDVLDSIFEFITDYKDYFTIRLSCKRWSVLHKQYTVNKLHRELNINFESLNTMFDEDRVWLAYIGDYDYYFDLMLSINNIIKSDELFMINCFTDEFKDIKRIKTTLKNFQTGNRYKLNKPIVINNYCYTLEQREYANYRMSKFVLLVKAEQKVVKDLSHCPSCMRLCKHKIVNIGHNLTEPEVIVSANMPLSRYDILVPGKKEWLEGSSFDDGHYELIRDKEQLAYIKKYVYAAQELGVKYFKYNTETGDVVFIV